MPSLVTGAAGFVGRQLTDGLLARGKAVRGLVRSPDQGRALEARGVETVVGDICDPGAVAAAVDGVDVVYHCAAAVGHNSKREIYVTNLGGVHQVLECARNAACGRVVFLSTVNVLGSRNLDPATEDLPRRRSHDPAADVKIEAEELVEDYVRQGLQVTVLRPGFIYGPGDTRNLPKLIDALRLGKFVFIGSRQNIIPLVHVDDVVQALLLAGENAAAAGRIYHVADGARTTIGEFMEYLAALLSVPPPRRTLPYFLLKCACLVFELQERINPPKRPAPINRAGLRFLGTSRFIDIRRATEELGYTPRVGFRTGIAATVQWLQEHSEETPHVSAASAGSVA